jgi:hypothetical protein
MPRSSTATRPTPTPRASTCRRRTSTITGTPTTDRARRVAGLLVLTLALAACGGGSDAPGQAGPAATTTTATAAATTTAPAATTTTAAPAPAWSTSAKHGPGSRQPPDGPSAKLAAVRAAGHPGYDRVVFQFDGAKVPAYRIGYVREIALGETDDQFLTLKGDALIEATFQGTASDDYRPGTQTMPDKLTPALPQVRQLGLAEDWEGVVRIGIGLDHRAGFRVLELTNPVRVVVDVAT